MTDRDRNIALYGPYLGTVSNIERERIMAMPKPQREAEIARIKRGLVDQKKRKIPG